MTYTKAFYWAQSVKDAMANARLAAIRMFKTYNDTDNRTITEPMSTMRGRLDTTSSGSGAWLTVVRVVNHK